MSIFFGPAVLPTVAHDELAPFASLATGEGLVCFIGFGTLFAPLVLCGEKAIAATCMVAELVRTGNDIGTGDVIAIGLLGKLVSRKILGNLTLGNPRATKPGSAGVVSTRVIRDDVVGSRLKGSRTGR
jgi:hypothetical protein